MRCVIELDFDLVDDICLACESGGLEPKLIPSARALRLGPLLELAQIAPKLGGGPLPLGWLETDGFEGVLGNLPRMVPWYGEHDRQGFVPVSCLAQDELTWLILIQKARAAATAAGFTGVHSAKLMAAIGEIYGNVIDHSRNAASGYVAYHATGGTFEFVIADRGIGVLESLRSNPKYAALVDSGTALGLALEQGVSRHTSSDHGFGFVPLFVGLANVSRYIRFRSGDYGRVIQRKRDGTIEARTIQLPRCDGLYCSVLCDLE